MVDVEYKESPTVEWTFQNVFVDHIDHVFKQVDSGVAGTKRFVGLLRKLCANDDEMARLIFGEMHSPCEPDGMESMHNVSKNYYELVFEYAQCRAAQSQSVLLEVVGPLEEVIGSIDARKRNLLQRRTQVIGEMKAWNDEVRSLEQQCVKSIQATKLKTEKEAAERAGGAPPQGFASKLAKAVSNLAGTSAEELMKQTMELVRRYQQAVEQCNMRQDTLYTEDFPGVLAGLQELEVDRLNAMRLRMGIYGRICGDVCQPLAVVANKLSQSVIPVDPIADLQRFTQNGLANFGPPQLPGPIVYSLPVTPKDLKAGRFEANPNSIYRNTLQRCMELQHDKFPQLDVPRIMIVCIDAVREQQGFQTEGIFRMSAAKSELDALQEQFDSGDFTIPPNISGPHLPACALKGWLRQCSEPTIPQYLYDEAVRIGAKSSSTPQATLTLYNQLDPVRRSVIRYLAWVVAEVVQMREVNKMSYESLSIVFAPSFLTNVAAGDDMFEKFGNYKAESRFVALLFQAVITVTQQPTPGLVGSGGGGGSMSPRPTSAGATSSTGSFISSAPQANNGARTSATPDFLTGEGQSPFQAQASPQPQSGGGAAPHLDPAWKPKPPPGAPPKTAERVVSPARTVSPGVGGGAGPARGPGTRMNSQQHAGTVVIPSQRVASPAPQKRLSGSGEMPGFAAPLSPSSGRPRTPPRALSPAPNMGGQPAAPKLPPKPSAMVAAGGGGGGVASSAPSLPARAKSVENIYASQPPS